MKKLMLLLVVLVNAINIYAKDKLEIVTTIFPNYDFIRNVGGDNVEVTILLPFGVEPHSYEPSPKDIVKMNKADLLVYTNDEMEPWVGKIKKSMNVKTLDLSDNLVLEESHEHEEDHHHEDDHHHAFDPHIWTDPVIVLDLIDNIANSLIRLDPANKGYYLENAESYKNKIKELDKKFLDLSDNSSRDTIVFTGHSVFGYFSERYHIEFISPYKNFSPNSEPSAKDVAMLRDYIEKNDIKYIYYEELVSPKISKLLQEELGVKALLLHGAHNVSKKEFKEGITYLKIMENNIKNLKLGLEYGK